MSSRRASGRYCESSVELTRLQLDSPNADLFDRRNWAVDELTASMKEPPNQTREQQERRNRAQEYQRRGRPRDDRVAASMDLTFHIEEAHPPQLGEFRSMCVKHIHAGIFVAEFQDAALTLAEVDRVSQFRRLQRSAIRIVSNMLACR